MNEERDHRHGPFVRDHAWAGYRCVGCGWRNPMMDDRFVCMTGLRIGDIQEGGE